MKRALAVALVAIVLGVTGCSSNKKPQQSAVLTPHSSTSASQTPTAATVLEGLGKISTLAGTIAATAATNPAQGKKDAEGIEPLWAPIEDVVKNNDSSAYLDLEDSFALLESGEASKATEGAGKVASTVTAYIAKYPG